MAKILLVEDDDLVRDMLTQVLERASHQVICAANGEEATDYYKKKHLISWSLISSCQKKRHHSDFRSQKPSS